MVYDRIEHLKECVNSLKSCSEAHNSTLYISSDAAYRVEDADKVKEIRNYIKSMTGFKTVIPIFHDFNKGLIDAYKYAVDLLFEEYDTLIFLEDDIIVAPDFLTFMNKGLNFYENSNEVISVSGFSQAVFFENKTKTASEVYFTNRWCPWGFGTWKHKFQEIQNVSLQDLEESLKDKQFIKKIDSIGIDLSTAFQRKVSTKEPLSLDYLYVYYMVKFNLFTVVPYTTKTFNTGNDGKGTRTRENIKYTLFDIRTLNKIVPFNLSTFDKHKINNTFNYLINNTLTNRIKKMLSRLGLLQFGYMLNAIKKRWRRKIRK